MSHPNLHHELQRDLHPAITMIFSWVTTRRSPPHPKQPEQHHQPRRTETPWHQRVVQARTSSHLVYLILRRNLATDLRRSRLSKPTQQSTTISNSPMAMTNRSINQHQSHAQRASMILSGNLPTSSLQKKWPIKLVHKTSVILIWMATRTTMGALPKSRRPCNPVVMPRRTSNSRNNTPQSRITNSPLALEQEQPPTKDWVFIKTISTTTPSCPRVQRRNPTP